MKYLMLFICFFLIHCGQQSQNSSVKTSTGQRGIQQTSPADTGTGHRSTHQNQRWTGSLKISNTTIYQDFLQANGICDTLTWNVGNGRCGKWDSTADVELIFEKNSLPSSVELRITPHSETSSNPYFQSPHIISVKGEANADNHGFQARLSEYSARFGSAGSNFSIIIQSEEGTPEERIINMDIFYGGRAHQDIKIGTLNLENQSKPVSTSDPQVTPGR